MSSKTRYGLVLDLPGAPETPHVIPGVAGYYRPNIPTPVGGDGELTLDAAKELDKGSEHLRLVEIAPKDVEAAEKVAADTLKEARNTKPAGRSGAEMSRNYDESEAQKGA